LIDNGKIRATTALNIGARLVAHDGADTIVRLKQVGAVLERSGAAARSRRKVSDELRMRLANRMAQALFAAVTTSAMPWEDFYVAPPLASCRPSTAFSSRAAYRN